MRDNQGTGSNIYKQDMTYIPVDSLSGMKASTIIHGGHSSSFWKVSVMRSGSSSFSLSFSLDQKSTTGDEIWIQFYSLDCCSQEENCFAVCKSSFRSPFLVGLGLGMVSAFKANLNLYIMSRSIKGHGALPIRSPCSCTLSDVMKSRKSGGARMYRAERRSER